MTYPMFILFNGLFSFHSDCICLAGVVVQPIDVVGDLGVDAGVLLGAADAPRHDAALEVAVADQRAARVTLNEIDFEGFFPKVTKEASISHTWQESFPRSPAQSMVSGTMLPGP